jgi:hypothetical protein
LKIKFRINVSTSYYFIYYYLRFAAAPVIA